MSVANLLWKMIRYGGAAIGPIGSAGAQFALSLVLLHTLSPTTFGAFSVLMVVAQLSTSIWSALFCASMPLLLTRGEQAERDTMRDCLMAASLALALLAVGLFFALALWLRTPLLGSLIFGAYGAVMLLRWFARAYAYAIGQPLRTMISDITYGVALTVGVAVIVVLKRPDLTLAFGALALSGGLGLAPFGITYLRRQFLDVTAASALRYGQIWREHARWSLFGVITTEATANAHAYIVTLFSGPAAFASLAAGALPMRPIGVVSNALAEFERPQLARQLAAGRRDNANKSLKLFHFVLFGVWAATLVAALILMRFAPQILFPPAYDASSLAIGLALWLAIALVRLVRTPESTLLQAAGEFRVLAHASMISCGVSVVGVTVLLAAGGPLWSLAGVLMGEAVFAFWIWRQKSRWLAGV